MELITTYPNVKKCSTSYVLAIQDTLNVLNGKWKMPILAALLYGNKRFKDIQSNIDNITPRMLSKELKELELNSVVKRNVYNSTPVLIEYELTESGKNITKVLDIMVEWGLVHREFVLNSSL